ncbi:MAG: lamin tail domain-containing protein [Saprospiraceae bacterium]|nr:lamin tail domain-containing protein [Saprospiraceae bacterium]
MKKKLLLLLCCFYSIMASAQLVITEISYNPPESGTDSLEYIELYNETGTDIDLAGYVIRDNNPHTIAAGTVPAGGYAILAINPAAITAILGVPSIEIADIALSNGGEVIFIEDGDGNVIDEVSYDDNEPWPTFEDGADGAGATIELCDVTSDNNDASNWNVSTNDLGVMVNGNAFLGTPNAENSSSCEFVPDHIVEVSSNVFTPADITIQVDESVRWINTGGFHNVNGGTDVYPDNPEGFSNGAASGDAWTFDYTFTIPGVYDYQCDPHVGLGMVGTVTVEGDVEPVIPTYDIGVVNTINSDGVGDSIGVECIVVGVSHGANLRGGGLQFALIDASGDALGLFSGGNLGYTYAEGDELKVTGSISQFNGLLQIDATAVEVLSSGNDLTGPVVVDVLDESTESKLVQINGLTMMNASDWEIDGSSFNADFMNADGDVFTIRVDSDTEVAGWDPGPTSGIWNIAGIGGQFDSDSPFLSGYQIYPRYITDFALVLNVEDELDVEIAIYPNPAQHYINVFSEVTFDKYYIYSIQGQLVAKSTFTNLIDVNELSNGSYILIVEKDGKSKSISFVK